MDRFFPEALREQQKSATGHEKVVSAHFFLSSTMMMVSLVVHRIDIDNPLMIRGLWTVMDGELYCPVAQHSSSSIETVPGQLRASKLLEKKEVGDQSDMLQSGHNGFGHQQQQYQDKVILKKRNNKLMEKQLLKPWFARN